jgi:hypothetical protein
VIARPTGLAFLLLRVTYELDVDEQRAGGPDY